MARGAFAKSYMVTNRYYPREEWAEYIYPTSAGTLYYCWAPGEYNPDPNAYAQLNTTPVTTMPGPFLAGLTADLLQAKQNGCPQITVYIHGLGNYLSDACTELGTYGANLKAQGYQGLLIGFSWPSYSEEASWKWYGTLPYAFPPKGTSGTIRDNINGSTKSLTNLLAMLAALCTKYQAQLNVLCHSEGNYMLMLAMNTLAKRFRGTVLLNQVLSLAADINTGGVQTKELAPPWSGQAVPFASMANRATVYWSSGDDILPYAESWTNYHNPTYPKRLGLHGPDTYATNSMPSTVVGLDCSLVVNETVISHIPQVPPGTTTHSAYFYIPQVLLDMTQTLSNTPANNVTNRASAPSQNGQAYRMLLSDTPREKFTPTGTRLQRRRPARRATR